MKVSGGLGIITVEIKDIQSNPSAALSMTCVQTHRWAKEVPALE